MGKVIIKCFRTPIQKYFYDRYTDSIIATTDIEYEILKKVERNQELPKNSLKLKRLLENGLLHETIVEKIEHPESDKISYLSEHRLKDLILQVTQQCNLRCKYCAYSGNYYNRSHSSQRMDFETAKRAIDFYLERSKEEPQLCVSFYGGEPLLEFELITKCTEYILNRKGDHPIRFNMTTNGTLLTQKKVKFFEQNNFYIMVSLDGSKESHDANRRYSNDKGSFDDIMDKLDYIRKNHSKFFDNNIRVNTVINAKTDMEETFSLLADSGIFKAENVNLNNVELTDIKDDNITKLEEKNFLSQEYEYLKMTLSLIGRRDWDSRSKLMRGRISSVELMFKQLHRHTIEGRCMHHAGPCLPGIRRLFVTVDGEFYPCERVSESNEEMKIGNLNQGFDYERMDLFINHGKIIKDKCLSCWNLRRCLFCIGSVGTHDHKISRELLLEKCNKSKNRTDEMFMEVCVLKEMGYKMDM